MQNEMADAVEIPKSGIGRMVMLITLFVQTMLLLGLLALLEVLLWLLIWTSELLTWCWDKTDTITYSKLTQLLALKGSHDKESPRL